MVVKNLFLKKLDSSSK